MAGDSYDNTRAETTNGLGLRQRATEATRIGDDPTTQQLLVVGVKNALAF